MHHQAALIMLALLAACDGDSPSGDDTGPIDTDTDTDTGTPNTDPLLQDIELELSLDVATVARVRWETSSPTTGVVYFGTPGGLEYATPSTAEGTSHEALLLGLRANSEVGYRVEVAAGEVTEASEELRFTTGSLPTGLPRMVLNMAEEGGGEGFTIVPVQGSTTCYTSVLDAGGEPVWASEIGCLTHRTRLLPDGSGFVSHFRGAGENPSLLKSVSFMGEQIGEIVVEGGHHDFAIVDDRTWAMLGYTVRTFDNEGEPYPLVGDTIIEIGPDGEQTVIWELFDHLQPNLSDWFPDSDWMPGTPEWSHSNYISYAPEEDAYYITDRSVNAIYKVDRSTGEHLWTLSDYMGDFQVDDEEPLVFSPHSVELTDDGLLVFNQAASWDGECSEAILVQIDEEEGRAWRSWTYETEDCLGVDYLGNAWPLDDGGALVVFSQMGQMDEVTAAGELTWRVNTEMGWLFSYAQRSSSLYVEQAGY
jgi:hypothetical protein